MFNPKTRILIVDDYESMRAVMKRAFNELGFQDVIEAENGVVAWNVIQFTTPRIGLIISDWIMPKSNGLELLTKVRQNPQTAAIPFILVTTEGEKDRVVEAVRAGVSNYVVKPFTTEILRKKLEAVHQKIKPS